MKTAAIAAIAGLATIAAAQPASTDLGSNPNLTTGHVLNAGEVAWFSFTLTGGAGAMPWSIDTRGSTNTGGSFADDDTELGLYDSTGALVASNDDEDFFGDILTSLISSDTVGALSDGTYYIASGSFNTTYGPAFGATSTSTATGNTVLNVSFVPAPAGIAALGLGGLVATRRRRA